MKTYPENPEPDAELRRLVSRYLDQSLEKGEGKRLERRLEEEPDAMDYFASSIRFDATLQEAVNPTSMEWEETRRMIFDPRKGDSAMSLQQHRRIRIGGSRSRRPLPWILGGAGVAVALALPAWFLLARGDEEFALRNGDFEAMALDQSPSPMSQSILYWQESFSTPGANLSDLNRTTGGKHYAKSGRNVVSLEPEAFLNQVIINGQGENLTAVPGLRVVVKGWYIDESSAGALECNLRFVASGYPYMIQYDAASTTIALEPGGWHPFRVELQLPEDLIQAPTILANGITDTPSPVDLEGKPLTLSVDNPSPDGTIFLDDLSIEVLRP